MSAAGAGLNPTPSPVTSPSPTAVPIITPKPLPPSSALFLGLMPLARATRAASRSMLPLGLEVALRFRRRSKLCLGLLVALVEPSRPRLDVRRVRLMSMLWPGVDVLLRAESTSVMGLTAWGPVIACRNVGCDLMGEGH